MRTLMIFLSILLLYPAAGWTQPNNWTMFPGHKLDCNAAPSSAISTLSADPIDPNTSTAYPFNEVINSCFYEDLGTLAFTVTSTGLFDNTGNMVYSWQMSVSTVTCPYTPYWSSSSSVVEGRIKSEIEIFPIPQKCHHYYVMFWMTNTVFAQQDLRLVEIDASAGISVVNDYILESVDGTGCGIVADISNSGFRNVYTLEPKLTLPSTHTTAIRKWVFKPDGTLTTSGFPTSYPSTITLPLPITTTAPRRDVWSPTVVELNNQGEIAYANNILNELYVYNVNTLTCKYLYMPPSHEVRGIEYVPRLGYWYVCWFDQNTTSTLTGPFGGVCFFDANDVSLPRYELVSSNIDDFSMTDLELSKSGYLYLAGTTAMTYGKDIITAPGNLAYINTNAITPGSVSSALSYVPVYLSPAVLVNGDWNNDNDEQPEGDLYYLENQIDNDSYTPWTYGSSGLYTINHLNSNIPACIPVHVCSGGAANIYFEPSAGGPGITSTQQYAVSWFQSDACGNPVSATSLNYTEPMHWGPASSIDLFTYGGGLLSSPAAQGKYFVIQVSITDWCRMISYAPHNQLIKIDAKPPLSNWKISDDGSGTSFIPPGNTCGAAPGACGENPAINFNKFNVNKYWMVIKDYGTSCTTTPVVIGDGSANKTPVTGSAPTFITEYLAEYMWGYSTSPAYSSLLDALAVFGNPSEIYGVQLFTENDCGVTSNTEKFFIGGLSCKQDNTSIPGDQVKNTVSVKPNPANSFINIHLEGLSNATVSMQLYNMQGAKVKNVIPQREVKDELRMTADVSSLPPGIYIYQCYINGTITSGKLIINH